MRLGTAIRIPDSSTRAGKETTQPGLPGRWSVWSAAAGGPGSYFVLPVDAEARATGIQRATVRVVEPKDEKARVSLLATEPGTKMPATRTARIA